MDKDKDLDSNLIMEAGVIKIKDGAMEIAQIMDGGKIKDLIILKADGDKIKVNGITKIMDGVIVEIKAGVIKIKDGITNSKVGIIKIKAGRTTLIKAGVKE